MSFIIKDDYRSIITDYLLDDVTEVDDDKITDCETQAIELMSGYLNARYDVTQVFNKTGNQRNPYILRLAMDITIYFLHKIGNGGKIPSHRAEAYHDAIAWLDKVNERRINPRDLPLVSDGSRDDVLFGGNPQRNNHI